MTTILYVNTGSSANAGDGDSLRTAFNKINANFTVLSTASFSSGTSIGSVTQSATPPYPPSQNTLWYDTTSGRTYVYWDNYWVDASPEVSGSSINSRNVVNGTWTMSVSTSGVVTMNSAHLGIQTWRREYQYQVGDIVIDPNYNNSLYIAVAPSLGGVYSPGSPLNAYWDLFVESGASLGSGFRTTSTLVSGSHVLALSTAGQVTLDGNLFVPDNTTSTLVNGSYTLNLTNTGVLQLPHGATLNGSTLTSNPQTDHTTLVSADTHGNQSSLDVSAVDGIRISTFYSDVHRQWLFNSDTGALQFPDTTLQDTAWTGTVAWSNITDIPPLEPTLPSTSTAGFLYDNGAGVLSWNTPTVSSLTKNGRSVTLDTQGNLSLPASGSIINAGGIGIANAVQLATAITNTGSGITNSSINLNAGNGTIGIRVLDVPGQGTGAVGGPTLMKVGTSNVTWGNFAGSVVSDPGVTNGEIFGINYINNTIDIGYYTNEGTITTTDYVAGIGVANSFTGHVSGLYADSTNVVISAGNSQTNTLIMNDAGVLITAPIFSSRDASLIDQSADYVPNIMMELASNINDYSEVSIQNHNDGGNASTDFIAYNNATTDKSGGYIDVGINSTNYVAPAYDVQTPGSGYMYTSDGDLVIGTAGPDGRLILHAGGTTSDKSVVTMDQYSWTFNRRVLVEVNRPSELLFLSWNQSNNVEASSVFQAQNDVNDYIKLGVNSSQRVDGQIQPSESFIYTSQETGTMHIGNKSSINFYASLQNGYLEVPTLRIDNTTSNVIVDGDLRPYEDGLYNLGSTSTYWKDFYVNSVHFHDSTTQTTAFDPAKVVTKITAGSGISISTSTGQIVIVANNQGAGTLASTSTLINSVSPSQLQIVQPPVSLVGGPADQVGNIAFDSTFIYYCTATYVASVYTAPALNDGVLVDSVILPQAQIGDTPVAGWLLQYAAGGTIFTVTTVTSGVYGDLSIPYYQLSIGSPALIYTTGTSFVTSTESVTPIWKTAPWDSLTQQNLNGSMQVGTLNVTTATVASSNSNVTRKSVSGLVGRGVSVTLDNITAQLAATGAAGLAIGLTGGTMTVDGSEQGSLSGSYTGNRINALALSPTPVRVSGNSYTVAGDVQRVHIIDQAGSGAWRITLVVGVGFVNNSVTIERLA